MRELAPLHPSFPRETTPIGTALDFSVAVRQCGYCNAVLDNPCRTATGKATKDHAGRWAA